MAPPDPRKIATPGGRTQVTRPRATTLTGSQQLRFSDLGNNSLQIQTTIFIALFRINSATNLPIQDFVNAAKNVLSPHKITLDLLPTNLQPTVIPYNGGPINLDSDLVDIRKSVDQVFTNSGDVVRLPVIFCSFHHSFEQEAAGLTVVDVRNAPDGRKTMLDGSTFLPFCLVDSAQGVAFNTTMVHEICHAARLEHPNAAGDANSIINVHKSDERQNPRSNMNGVLVRAVAGAYFAKPRTAVPYNLP